MGSKKIAKDISAYVVGCSRDGALAVCHSTTGAGGNALAVVDTRTGKESRVTLPGAEDRVGGAAFLGAELAVLAQDDQRWHLVLFDGAGQAHVDLPLGNQGNVGAALATAADGRVAALVGDTLHVWAPGAAGAPTTVANPAEGTSRSNCLAYTSDGELLVLGESSLFQFDAKLAVRAIAMPGVTAEAHLTCVGDAVAFQGTDPEKENDGDGPHFANECTFVVDRRTGKTLSKHFRTFQRAGLTPEGLLVGASSGLAGLKKIGWKRAVRTDELAGGYVQRCRLDGTVVDTVPMKLGRVDAMASAGDWVIVGTAKDATWMGGVFP